MFERDELPPDVEYGQPGWTENCCHACNCRGHNCQSIFREEGRRCCSSCKHTFSTLNPVEFWKQKAEALSKELIAARELIDRLESDRIGLESMACAAD